MSGCLEVRIDRIARFYQSEIRLSTGGVLCTLYGIISKAVLQLVKRQVSTFSGIPPEPTTCGPIDIDALHKGRRADGPRQTRGAPQGVRRATNQVHLAEWAFSLSGA